MSKDFLAQGSFTTTEKRQNIKLKLGIAGLCLAIFIALLSAFWISRSPPAPTAIADFKAPFVFGRFSIPEDNPLTEEAFQLGRRLFYDPMLSGDNSMSCATCHQQERAFTDGQPVALGHGGKELAFNSMSLANLLWGPRRFFWDGRSPTLEHQALQPLINPDEMQQPLDELVRELKSAPEYPEMFWKAYGEVSEENVARALATFMRMLISANSKYDRYLRGELRLSPQEEHGRKLFMAHPDVKASLRGGNCIDCHSQFVTAGFSDGWDGFINNGLDAEQNLGRGLEAVTGDILDRGKFKTPTLRNIAVTGPYMHDGRFATLSEVLTHYNSGIRFSDTLSPLILEADNTVVDPIAAHGLGLAPKEVDAIIAFLHTLTDEAFLTEPKFSSPFEEETQ
ncbi:cytochrome-c peroxidase [Ruegeria conchae]|uniref:cytochrome-c peroxidase n=1 Tax=Ruegeria conchae TaxID=981384 RepID=UPI0021A70809|nr:cytochrome c peroxidase [Ruegeria conchae]UWR02782.1 cytochrome-c peroxidase [Ruegeria conchae]